MTSIKKRSVRFSKNEENILIQLVSEQKNKNKDGSEEKIDWRELAEKFNSVSSEKVRTAQALRTKYKVLRKNGKDNVEDKEQESRSLEDDGRLSVVIGLSDYITSRLDVGDPINHQQTVFKEEMSDSAKGRANTDSNNNIDTLPEDNPKASPIIWPRQVFQRVHHNFSPTAESNRIEKTCSANIIRLKEKLLEEQLCHIRLEHEQRRQIAYAEHEQKMLLSLQEHKIKMKILEGHL